MWSAVGLGGCSIQSKFLQSETNKDTLTNVEVQIIHQGHLLHAFPSSFNCPVLLPLSMAVRTTPCHKGKTLQHYLPSAKDKNVKTMNLGC